VVEDSLITREEKLACARRELAMRYGVYGKRVAEGRMSKQKADREIELMKAIVDDYESGCIHE